MDIIKQIEEELGSVQTINIGTPKPKPDCINPLELGEKIIPPQWVKPPGTTTKKRIRLICNLCPGDVMTLTAAVFSLHKQYEKQYETEVVTTSGKDIFLHNPLVVDKLSGPADHELKMEYDLIHSSGQRSNTFLHGYVHNLGKQLGIKLDLMTNRPHLYESVEEKNAGNPLVKYVPESQANIKFALINAGMKNDFTTKLYPTEYYQEIVDGLRDVITFVQIGAVEPNHYHPRLKNTIDLCGATSQRDLLLLAKYAEFGLGSVTFLQHIMAAWEKPYFCLLGGREGLPWAASYPRQQTFSMIGALPCCIAGGCWRSRTVPLGDGADKTTCEYPMLGFSMPVPKCMAMIKPQDVIERVRLVCACTTYK